MISLLLEDCALLDSDFREALVVKKMIEFAE